MSNKDKYIWKWRNATHFEIESYSLVVKSTNSSKYQRSTIRPQPRCDIQTSQISKYILRSVHSLTLSLSWVLQTWILTRLSNWLMQRNRFWMKEKETLEKNSEKFFENKPWTKTTINTTWNCGKQGSRQNRDSTLEHTDWFSWRVFPDHNQHTVQRFVSDRVQDRFLNYRNIKFCLSLSQQNVKYWRSLPNVYQMLIEKIRKLSY